MSFLPKTAIILLRISEKIRFDVGDPLDWIFQDWQTQRGILCLLWLVSKIEWEECLFQCLIPAVMNCDDLLWRFVFGLRNLHINKQVGQSNCLQSARRSNHKLRLSNPIGISPVSTPVILLLLYTLPIKKYLISHIRFNHNVNIGISLQILITNQMAFRSAHYIL